jgi:rhamnosyltransferase
VTAPPCCALIVTYHPPASVLAEIATIRAQCARVIVIDNASDPAELGGLERLAAEAPDVELIRNATNVGLAAALNQGCRLAREQGFEWILLLDQDTDAFATMVEALHAAVLAHPHPERVGVVGSNHYDELGRLAHKPHANEPYRVVPFVITSGSLLRLAVLDEVGPFRDDMFIDYVDIEFGFRLEKHGRESLLCMTPTMRHIWGNPRRVRILGREIMVTNHSAFRRYFIVRNGIYVMTRYWPTFPLRCTWGIATVFINASIVIATEPQRWRKAKAMFVGFWHGLFGRLGPIPRGIG